VDEDIFAEVRHIEKEAERILSEARSDREKALQEARDETDTCREQSQKKLNRESDRLRETCDSKLAEEKASVEEDFQSRKTGFEDTGAKRTDELAAWVVSRFLKEHQ